MFSTLTIISIFTEIFASGILLSGIYSFFIKFLQERKLRYLLLGFIFICFAGYTILTIASQIHYDLGGLFSQRELIHRAIALILLFGSFLILWFIKERFEVKRTGWLLILALLFILYLVFMVCVSPINLTYGREIIEPVVIFLLLPVSNPDKVLWAAMWGLLALISFIRAPKYQGGQRALTLYLGFSALLLLASFFFFRGYLNNGQGSRLLLSWIMTLLGILGLTLAEIIPPSSPAARNPLNFLRTRILIKLILIFVLLIIILFEITTLATLTISKQALQKSIVNTYQETALGLANQIENMKSLDPKALNQIVLNKKIGKSGLAWVVNQKGIILAHPDPVLLGADQSGHPVIKSLLRGKSWGGEFPPDELGKINVGAYVPLLRWGGGVVVEESLADAYFEMRQLESYSLLFTIIGLALTLLTGIFFARSIERPIYKLKLGTEAVAAGDLNYRINLDSTDELGSLAAAFNKMTQDLANSQERLILSEKLVSLGTMAAGMAHEIKNPLVSLRTFSQLIDQKWEDKEFREKFKSIVPVEIDRINRIAESLLKFGRPLKPELTGLKINSLLEEVLLLLESECRKNNIRVTTKFAELPDILGDPGQLSQAFLNIVLNAVQAMSDTGKGGELIVKTDVGEVVKLGRLGKGVEKAAGEVVWEAEEEKPKPIPAVFIEVTDTGPGIEPEKIKSLFDPFFTTKTKGTGMGLPITLRIIEEHKGSIKVRSQVGKGTTFIITLPQKMSEV